jgi:hypothetical protein
MLDRLDRLVRHRRLRAALVELVLVAALFNLYRFGRAAIDGQEATARANAELVTDLQRATGLPSEATVQQLFDLEPVLRLANTYYTGVHFPLMVLFLAWGFVRRSRHEYLWARNVIAIQTGAALLIHMAFPLAPPRMFPQWGFVDSMAVYGPSAYDGVSGDVANQFAAMPSLHVGWAVAIAYIVFRTGPRPLAALAALHAATTYLVVIVTANHWWLDGIVAIALLVLAVTLARLLAGRTLRRRLHTRLPRPSRRSPGPPKSPEPPEPPELPELGASAPERAGAPADSGLLRSPGRVPLTETALSQLVHEGPVGPGRLPNRRDP